MGKPYTQRFLLATGAPGESTYTVPENRRVVLTNIVGSCGGSSLVDEGIALVVHGKLVWQWRTPGGYGAFAEAFRLVAYERETIVMSRWAKDIGAMLSGFIFEDSVGPEGVVTERDYLLAGSLPAELARLGRQF